MWNFAFLTTIGLCVCIYVISLQFLYKKVCKLSLSVCVNSFFFCIYIFVCFSESIHSGFPFEPKDFEDLAKEYGHTLRDGTHDLLELTNKLNVPVLVLSAGRFCYVDFKKNRHLLAY